MDRAEPERTLTNSGAVRIAELFPGELFEARDIFRDFGAQFLRKFMVVLEVVVACLGGDRESGRNRQTDVRHLRKSGAFAAQKILHVSRAVGFSRTEEINVFHVSP